MLFLSKVLREVSLRMMTQRCIATIVVSLSMIAAAAPAQSRSTPEVLSDCSELGEPRHTGPATPPAASHIAAALAQLERGCPAHVSIEYLQSAEDAGSDVAAFALGLLFEEGVHIASDLNVAAHHYRKAAVWGHLEAQHRLGMLLLGDLAPTEDIEEGLYWLGAAVNQGDGFSAAVIGVLHAHGMRGVRQDPCLAVSWFDVSEMLDGPMEVGELRAEAASIGGARC